MGKTTRASAATKARDKKASHGGRRGTRSQAQSGDLLDPRESERNEKALKHALSSMGLYAAQTKGDGNCLFRALSDQLWGHDLSHAWLRREICAYLAAHRERCENFVDADGGFDKYVRDMQASGTYGGHLELQVCAWLMRVNIKVIQPTSVYVISPSDESPATSSSTSDAVPPPTSSASSTSAAVDPPPLSAASATPSSAELTADAPRSPSSSSLSSLTPSPPPLPADPADQATTSSGPPSKAVTPVAAAPAAAAEPEASSSTVNTIYVAYHAYEHYSSVRNVGGPKTGLPCTKEIARPPSASGPGAASSSAAAAAAGRRAGEWGAEDAEPVPSSEEMLVLSSLPPSAFTLAEIRRTAAGLARADRAGEPPAWETVVEVLLEQYESRAAADAASGGGGGELSKTAWREVEGLAGTESDASGRTTTGRGKKVGVGRPASSGRGRGRGRGRGKSRSSLGARVAGRRAGSSPSTASSDGTSVGGDASPATGGSLPMAIPPRMAANGGSSPLAMGDDDDGHDRSSPSLSPPPDTPPPTPPPSSSTTTTTRVRLKRPPPSSAGSYTHPSPHLGSASAASPGRPGKERRRERKARADQEKAARRSAGAVGVGLRTRSRAPPPPPEERVGEVEGGMREIHI